MSPTRSLKSATAAARPTPPAKNFLTREMDATLIALAGAAAASSN